MSTEHQLLKMILTEEPEIFKYRYFYCLYFPKARKFLEVTDCDYAHLNPVFDIYNESKQRSYKDAEHYAKRITKEQFLKEAEGVCKG